MQPRDVRFRLKKIADTIQPASNILLRQSTLDRVVGMLVSADPNSQEVTDQLVMNSSLQRAEFNGFLQLNHSCMLVLQ